MDSIYHTDPAELLDFAEAYASLGDAITSQLRSAATMQLEPDQSVPMTYGALRYADERLRGKNAEIDHVLDWVREQHSF